MWVLSVCISHIIWKSNPTVFLTLSSELVIVAEIPDSERGNLSQGWCSLLKLNFLIQCCQSIGIKLVLFLTGCFSGIFASFCRITEGCSLVVVVLPLNFCLNIKLLQTLGAPPGSKSYYITVGKLSVFTRISTA